MKKFLFLSLFYLLAISTGLVADDVVGFWKSMDEKTGKPQAIIAIYPYQGDYYGRLIATYDDNGNLRETIYNPVRRAPGVKGHPFFAGMDILWDLKKDGSKFEDGEIIDPRKGKTYDAEMWLKDGNLVVRGKILMFGQNQVWPPAQDSDFSPNFQKPDLTQFVPVKPEVNR
jgi:uncharacterized protein (DUF2147 family)